MLNRNRNFKVGIASRETIRFLTLRFPKGPDVTVTWSFQTDL